MKKIIYLFLFAAISLTLIACGDDNSESKSETNLGEGNTTDVAVTGDVQSIGMTYATVIGYVNFVTQEAYASLGTLYKYGIEYSTSPEFDNSQLVYGSSIVGRKFTVNISGLKTNTVYYYRAFVDQVKATQNNTFTTKDISINNYPEIRISDVSFISAHIKVSLSNESMAKETFKIGIAISPNEDILDESLYYAARFHDFSEENYPGIYFNEKSNNAQISIEDKNAILIRWNDGQNAPFEFDTDELEYETTFYFKPFIEIGNQVVFGNAISPNMRKLVMNVANFKTGTYNWAYKNYGANNPFKAGTEYQLTTQCGNSETGLDNEDIPPHVYSTLPPANIVEELNSCKHELYYVNTSLYGIIVTDINGNELFFPNVKYITRDVEETFSNWYGHTVYNRIYFAYSESEKKFYNATYDIVTTDGYSNDNHFFIRRAFIYD
ncbi:MAG: hypothetical protein K6F89_06130 [Prevotella sp.]|nr:hypothetical protein [Prevotella sp.]